MRDNVKDKYAGKKLTGIRDLRGKYENVPAVVCGSGTSLEEFDAGLIPEEWPIVAVNEAIRGVDKRATFWVLSDEPIVREYYQHCPVTTSILAMHQATLNIKGCCPKNKVYTTMSHAVAKEYGDGVNFFSRGTVLIGAIEMLRYMGVKTVFCFGLDCFRKRKQYYYDKRSPVLLSETKTYDFEMVTGDVDVPSNVQIWVTTRLKRMIVKLDEARKSGLWNDIELHCVNSPFSQQKAIRKMSLEEFEEEKGRWITNGIDKRDKSGEKKLLENAKKVPATEQQSSGNTEGRGNSGGSGSVNVESRRDHENRDVSCSGDLRSGDTQSDNDESVSDSFEHDQSSSQVDNV